MAYSNAAASAGNGDPTATKPTFRAAIGLYAGALLAGSATTGAALAIDDPLRLVAIAAVTFASGTVVGAGLAGRPRDLPARLGRTWRRKLAVVCAALPFAAVIVGSVMGPLGSPVGHAALGSAFAVGISGLVLSQVAENSYVDAAIRGVEPVASWRWDWSPSGSRAFDLSQFLLVGTGGLLAVLGAIDGDWWTAIAWIGLIVAVAVVNIAEGRWVRWLPGTPTARVRVYEHGFATERPLRRQFVPWSSIVQVQLRDDALVVDRGTFDHQFDRDDLEDAEAFFAALERRLEASSTDQ